MEDALLVEFMYLVFTCMPGESYRVCPKYVNPTSEDMKPHKEEELPQATQVFVVVLALRISSAN